jgi:Polyketide cyclase / dehydrase and lipid transport
MIEEHIDIPVAPSVVFKIWSEVDRWKDWDPDTQRAHLDGAFAAGSTGQLVPTKGNGVKILITECTPDQSFTCEGGIPGFKMRFVHEVRATHAGCEVTHRVTFSGILRLIFAPLVGAQVRKGLPVTMASLKRYAIARNKSV